ncbi:MAG: hypothetical protein JXR37_26545 [Kiritimatiellae bacterium]|nr:hypothetical protein [Kiritimatiellia bacterium]
MQPAGIRSAEVKCLLPDPESRHVDIMQAREDEGVWWNDHLTRITPDGSEQDHPWLKVPDRLYKVRRADQPLHLR